MKKIGFIGAYDKTDMLINLGKILTMMKKRVLIIDSTLNQKAKYIVPVINPTAAYITDFEDIDVAVGFQDIKQIKMYQGGPDSELPYDIILIDADVPEKIEQFDLYTADKKYFVTGFDLYSLKKGLEIFTNIKNPMTLTKILFAQEILKEDDDYLNYRSLGYRVEWTKERIYFPLQMEDMAAIIENQRVAKIKFRKLSAPYKDALIYLVQDMLENVTETKVRRVVKIIEKGV